MNYSAARRGFAREKKFERSVDSIVRYSRVLLKTLVERMATQLNPEMWNQPIKSGQLIKRGHVRKNWKERWFVLQKDNLFYFKGKTDPKPIGHVPLRGAVVQKASSFKPFTFEVNSPAINKQFFIKASNEAECKVSFTTAYQPLL